MEIIGEQNAVSNNINTGNMSMDIKSTPVLVEDKPTEEFLCPSFICYAMQCTEQWQSFIFHDLVKDVVVAFMNSDESKKTNFEG